MNQPPNSVYNSVFFAIVNYVVAFGQKVVQAFVFCSLKTQASIDI